jgi:hypothetical protein
MIGAEDSVGGVGTLTGEPTTPFASALAEKYFWTVVAIARPAAVALAISTAFQSTLFGSMPAINCVAVVRAATAATANSCRTNFSTARSHGARYVFAAAR